MLKESVTQQVKQCVNCPNFVKAATTPCTTDGAVLYVDDVHIAELERAVPMGMVDTLSQPCSQRGSFAARD